MPSIKALIFWFFLINLTFTGNIRAAHKYQEPILSQLSYNPSLFYSTQEQPQLVTVNAFVSRTVSYPQQATLSTAYQLNVPAYKNAFLTIANNTTAQQLQNLTQQHRPIVQHLPHVMLYASNAQLNDGLSALRVQQNLHLKTRLELLKDMGLPNTTLSLTAHQEQRVNPGLLCCYYENEGVIRQLNFAIEARDKSLSYNNSLIQPYEVEYQAAERSHRLRVIDTRPVSLLEKQVPVLKNYMQRLITAEEHAQKNKTDLTAQLMKIREDMKSLTAWADGGKLHDLKLVEKEILAKIAQVGGEIEYCKKWLPVCEADLKKLEELIAYNKQCIEIVAQENLRFDALYQKLDTNGILDAADKQSLTALCATTADSLTEDGLSLLKHHEIDPTSLQNFTDHGNRKELVGRLYAIINHAGKTFAEQNDAQIRAYAAATTYASVTAFDMVRQGTPQQALALTSLASTLDQATNAALGLVSNTALITDQFRQTNYFLVQTICQDPKWLASTERASRNYGKISQEKQNQHAMAFFTDCMVPELDHLEKNILLGKTVRSIKAVVSKEKITLAQSEQKSASADLQAPLLTAWKDATKSMSTQIAHIVAAQKARQVTAGASASATNKLAQRDLALVAAAKQLHKDSFATHTAIYAINSDTQEALKRLGFDLKKDFDEHYSGNQMQHYVHEKLITTLNRVGAVSLGKIEVEKLLKGAVILNKTGQTLNNNQHTQQALSAQHACAMVIDYAKTVADIGLAVGEGVADGVKSSFTTLGNIGKTALDAATFPEESIPKVYAALNRTSIAISEFAADIRETARLMSNSDTESLLAFARKRDENGQLFEKLSTALLQRYHETPLRDKVKTVAQFITEWECLGSFGETFCEAAALHRAQSTINATGIITHPNQTLAREVIDVTINTVAHEPAAVKNALKAIQQDNAVFASARSPQEGLGKQIANFLNKPIDIIETSPGFLEISNKPKALPKPAGQPAVSPVTPTAHIETKITHAARVVEHAQIGTKAAIAIKHAPHAKDYPVKEGFKALVNNAGKKHLGEVHYLPIKCPTSKELYAHIFAARINKRKQLTGGHMPKKQPGLIVEVSEGPNHHGIKEVLLQKDNILSQKTVGPDSWNQVDYIRHLKEAYSNIVEKEFKRDNVFKLIGIDKSGITWEMYIELVNDSYKITTGYPKI